jgi:hypothetical protein
MKEITVAGIIVVAIVAFYFSAAPVVGIIFSEVMKYAFR